MIEIFVFIFGIIFMLFSSFYLISSISNISKKLKFTGIFAGSILFALVITFPELSNNIIASMYNIESVGIGNLVGLVLVDNFLLFGLLNMLIKKKFSKEDNFYIGYFMFSTLVLFLLSLDHHLSKVDGIILISIFLPYLEILFGSIKGAKLKSKIPILDLISLPLSVFIIVVSSWMLISTSKFISSNLGLTLGIFGITIITFITAVPEFSSGIVSMLESKRERNILIGGIYGANMVNLVLIPGIATLIKPFYVTSTIINSLFFVLIGFSYIYFYYLFKKKSGMEFGLSLLFIYALYLILLFSSKI